MIVISNKDNWFDAETNRNLSNLFGEIEMEILILLVGSFLAALISGVAGFGGSMLLLPVAAVFLSLDLAPGAYIASEAATATAMHILKTIIYSKLTNMNYRALLIGLVMGLCMVIGTYVAKHFIKKMEKEKFQKYVAVLLCIVGIYMVVCGV